MIVFYSLLKVDYLTLTQPEVRAALSIGGVTFMYCASDTLVSSRSQTVTKGSQSITRTKHTSASLSLVSVFITTLYLAFFSKQNHRLANIGWRHFFYYRCAVCNTLLAYIAKAQIVGISKPNIHFQFKSVQLAAGGSTILTHSSEHCRGHCWREPNPHHPGLRIGWYFLHTAHKNYALSNRFIFSKLAQWLLNLLQSCDFCYWRLHVYSLEENVEVFITGYIQKHYTA